MFDPERRGMAGRLKAGQASRVSEAQQAFLDNDVPETEIGYRLTSARTCERSQQVGIESGHCVSTCVGLAFVHQRRIQVGCERAGCWLKVVTIHQRFNSGLRVHRAFA
jgi:hypothetical protein